MTAPGLTEGELAAIAAIHTPDAAYRGQYCQVCGPEYGRWPCDAVALLAEVRRLQALVPGPPCAVCGVPLRADPWCPACE